MTQEDAFHEAYPEFEWVDNTIRMRKNPKCAITLEVAFGLMVMHGLTINDIMEHLQNMLADYTP